MPRNHFLLALALSCCLAMPVQGADVRPAAPDLGTFAGEADMQHDLLQMLATHEPDKGQLEVAVVALREALGETAPATMTTPPYRHLEKV